MSRVVKFVAANLLAFGSLFFVSPAFASDWQTTDGLVDGGSVQFNYMGGSASRTITDGTGLVLSVDNTIANRIGWGEPLPDNWTVSINGEVVAGNAVEVTSIPLPAGEVVLSVWGIDNGYWAGWYGPRFTLVVPVEPIPNWWTEEVWEGGNYTFTAPEGSVITSVRAWYGAPNDRNCGADVSELLSGLVAGQSAFTVSLSNGTFGDPCGGVVKVTQFSVTYSVSEPITTEVTRTEEVVRPEPPVVVPQPAFSPEPVPEPAPTEEPVVPTPETSPEPTPTPSEQPTKAPEPVVEVVEPVVVIEPVVEPPVASVTVSELAAAAVADDPVVPEELAAIPLFGDAAVAVLEAFNALGNIGADMTPEVRETAQETIVASVIVSNIASTSVMASAASYRRNK